MAEAAADGFDFGKLGHAAGCDPGDCCWRRESTRYVAAHDRTGPARPAKDDRFRLPPGRREREGGAGARRLRQRRAALRPDERSDERRHPPAVEGASWSTGSTRGRGETPARCRRRHRRHRPARFLDRDRRRRRRVIVCDINPAHVAIGRDRAIDRGVLHGIEWLCGDAERLPIAERQRRCLYHRLRPAQRHRISTPPWPRRGGCCKPGGRFFCLEFSRVVLPAPGAALRSLFLPRPAAARRSWSPATATPTNISSRASAASRRRSELAAHRARPGSSGCATATSPAASPPSIPAWRL